MTKIKAILSRTARNTTPVLGVNVDSAERVEVLTRAYGKLRRRRVKNAKTKPFFIITPNPEIVYRASNDERYRSVLNKADLAPIDGVGLRWAMGIAGGKNAQTMPGRVLVYKMIEFCARHGLRVFLLGGLPGVAERAAIRLSSTFHFPPSIFQWDAGPWLNEHGESKTNRDRTIEREAVDKINKFSPALLVVCFGPPKQELWIYRNLDKLRINVVIGAGGTLDYLAGTRLLPPKFISNSGFEWVWRLVTQPYRLPRILTATVLFPLRVLASRFL